MTLQLQRAKTNWSGCCQMAVHGTLWLVKRYPSTLICFLNRISLLFVSHSYQIVLTTPSFFMTMQGITLLLLSRSSCAAGIGDSVTSTVLTRAIMISSPNWNNHCEGPLQHKRWTYPCSRAVNTEHQQKWTPWWCATPSKHLEKGDK